MRRDGVCVVVGAGDCADLRTPLAQGDLLIAADAGYKHCLRWGITPDWLVGDFDSLQTQPEGIPTRRLDPVKDETDTDVAVRLGIEQGFRRFSIYGGMGGRLSHTLANIQLAARLSQQGMRVHLYGKTETLTAITNGEYRFSPRESGYLSVFAHSERCEGVTETGLAYGLDGVTLKNTFPLGVSNAFIGQPGEVRVQKGTLVLLWGE